MNHHIACICFPLKCLLCKNKTKYLPSFTGVGAAWMNLSSQLSSGNGLQGWHTEHHGLRTLTVNTAQKALFILMKPNITATIHIQLSISKQEEEQEEPQKSTKVRYWVLFSSSKFEVKVDNRVYMI